MNLVNAYVIYNGTTGIYVGGQGVVISINCDRLQAYSPRPVWLVRYLAPGDGTIINYNPTFNPTSAELLDPNTVQGFWIEQDGQDVMVDVTSITAFQEACNACCGEAPTIIASTYGEAGPDAFAPLTLNTICITTADSGSAGDHDAFAAKYVGQYVGTAVLRASFSGVSKYTLTTYWTHLTFPVQGDDSAAASACSGI